MDGYQELTSAEGHLLLGGMAEVGVFSCPWQVKVQPGQKVEFSAYDFHGWRATQGQEDSTTRATRCKHMLTFEEAGQKSKVHVCARAERLNHVFTSVGHIVRIYLQHHLSVSKEHTFILRYKGKQIAAGSITLTLYIPPIVLCPFAKMGTTHLARYPI